MLGEKKKEPRTGEDGASRVPKSGTEPIKMGSGKIPIVGGTISHYTR